MKKRNKVELPGYDPKNVKLSKDEQEFEDQLDVSGYSERSPKSERMNIRLSQEDLTMLRDLAVKQGIPYQTLVGSVIHRYVTNQLIDVDEAKKIFDAKTEKKRA